jgi:hypothetical protein
MLVRGVVTDASTPSELTQRELETLRFAQNFEGGDDHGTAQIAVMVWPLLDLVGLRHGNPNLCRIFRHLVHGVDNVNIATSQKVYTANFEVDTANSGD